METQKVIIIGGGIGGLCLAQALKRIGVPFVLFEQDATLGARDRGHRLRIDAAGQDALARCVPVDLLYLVHRTASLAEPGPWFVDSRLRPVQWPISGGWTTRGNAVADICVHGQTMREILASGLEEHIRFDHALIEYEESAEGVTARFANGHGERGTLLVGADGIGSAVRRQLLPGVVPEDTGLACINGRTRATIANCRAIGPEICAGSSAVVADGFLAIIDLMFFRDPMPRLATQIVPDCQITDVPEYFHWALTGTRARLGVETLPGTPRELDGIVRQLVRDWDPALQAVFLRGDPAEWAIHPVCSLWPDRAWQSQRVTLLGDAIHAMSPANGSGMVTALCDAADLSGCLARAGRGEGRAAMLEAYAVTMRERAIDAVRAVSADGSRLAAAA